MRAALETVGDARHQSAGASSSSATCASWANPASVSPRDRRIRRRLPKLRSLICVGDRAALYRRVGQAAGYADGNDLPLPRCRAAAKRSLRCSATATWSCSRLPQRPSRNRRQGHLEPRQDMPRSHSSLVVQRARHPALRKRSDRRMLARALHVGNGPARMIYLLVDRYHPLARSPRPGLPPRLHLRHLPGHRRRPAQLPHRLLFGPRSSAGSDNKKSATTPTSTRPRSTSMMEGKKGTPTMGGILIIFAIAITHASAGRPGQLLRPDGLSASSGSARRRDRRLAQAHRRAAARGTRQGLTSLEKLLFQIGLGVILAILHLPLRPTPRNATPSIFPFVKDLASNSPSAASSSSRTLVITGSSNAVNLTDGLDGLAAGCMAIVSFAFLRPGPHRRRLHARSNQLLLPYIPGSDKWPSSPAR